MADIVISYSREDKKKARLLADKLMASGWSVWWDRELLGGQDYDTAIEMELKISSCVIVIWSPLSVKSHFVRDEANAALARNILVPVSFDDTEPPLGFRMTHIIKFEDSNDISDEDYSRLYQSIVKKAGEPGNPIPVPPPPKKASKMGWLLLGLAATIVIIYFIASGTNKRNTSDTGKSTKDDPIVSTDAPVTEQPQNQPHVFTPAEIGAFLNASASGDINTLKTSLDLGLNADVTLNSDPTTALVNAVNNNHGQAVKLLLERGANPNVKLTNGSYPIIEAAFKGFPDILDLLIQHKADINVTKKDGSGITALMFACFLGKKEIVQRLINANAAVNLKNWQSSTALDYANALPSPVKEEIASILSSAGAITGH